MVPAHQMTAAGPQVWKSKLFPDLPKLSARGFKSHHSWEVLWGRRLPWGGESRCKGRREESSCCIRETARKLVRMELSEGWWLGKVTQTLDGQAIVHHCEWCTCVILDCVVISVKYIHPQSITAGLQVTHGFKFSRSFCLKSMSAELISSSSTGGS